MKITSKIPSDIYQKILAAEKNEEPSRRVRYYPYFELQGGALAIAVVGVKTSGKRTKGKRHKCLYIKKATVHIVGKPVCYHRDIWLHGIGGYIIEFYKEPSLDTSTRKVICNAYNEKDWYKCEAKYFRIYNAERKILNLDFLQTLPEYRYCGYDGSSDALDYLNAYIQNPKIELLAKFISPRIAQSKTIAARAGKDKQFVLWLRDNAEAIKSLQADVPTIIKSYTHGISIEEADHTVRLDRYLSSRHSYYWDENSLYAIFPNERERMRQYLKDNDIRVAGYIDYLRALKDLGLDLKAEKNLFPYDWEYWHNVRLNQYATKQAEKNERERSELSRKIKTIAEKYAALAGGDGKYIAVLADSKASLVFEGERLNHCVGRMDYDQRIIKEQSLIFFIRKTDAPAVPLVTVEFSLGRQVVLQCYGRCDSKPPEDICDFVYNRWQPAAQEALKAMKKTKAA